MIIKTIHKKMKMSLLHPDMRQNFNASGYGTPKDGRALVLHYILSRNASKISVLKTRENMASKLLNAFIWGHVVTRKRGLVTV